MLIDTHCHLNFSPLAEKLETVLERARHAGIGRMVIPAYDAASWPDIARLVERYDTLYAAFGLHPWVLEDADSLDELPRWLDHPRCVAIGEIGLDFAKEGHEDRNLQIASLRRQLDLAKERDLPVLLHCRKAFDFLPELLASYAPIRGVIHAYSQSPQLAERLTDLGLHLGFGGAITRKNAKRAKKSAISVPMECIVLETDAPSIGTESTPPENVEPCHVEEIASALATLRGIDVSTVARFTSANAAKLFGWEIQS